jgi:hypothetical protein
MSDENRTDHHYELHDSLLALVGKRPLVEIVARALCDAENSDPDHMIPENYFLTPEMRELGGKEWWHLEAGRAESMVNAYNRGIYREVEDDLDRIYVAFINYGEEIPKDPQIILSHLEDSKEQIGFSWNLLTKQSRAALSAINHHSAWEDNEYNFYKSMGHRNCHKDLYQALEALLGHADRRGWGTLYPKTMDQANAALRKARGE